MLLEVEFILDFSRIIWSLWSFSLQIRHAGWVMFLGIVHVLKVLFQFDWVLFQVAILMSRDPLYIV
jgi:hypothetical protein